MQKKEFIAIRKTGFFFEQREDKNKIIFHLLFLVYRRMWLWQASFLDKKLFR